MDPAVRSLANEINKRKPDRLTRRRQAVVQAVDWGVGRCDIAIAGSSITVTGVAFLDSYGPNVGDTVWVWQDGSDLIILGAQSPAPPWTEYEADLGGSTTDPLIGTGGIRHGRYERHGQTCTADIYIVFGTGSTNKGSGLYQVALPFPADARDPRCIGGGFIHQSGDQQLLVAARLPGGGGSYEYCYLVLNNNGLVDDSTPTPWGVNDVVADISIRFEVLAGF